jgi:hypothetical protein
MNVLILTPDRVGSTLLQRLITIYMIGKGFDKPIINLHELTNGLIKYYNSFLNTEVLGKAHFSEWGYSQSLFEIIDYLKITSHYTTARLAHYHIERRKDPLPAQLEFYDFLNKNFYIISCRRENIFEYAISWCIFAFSKHLNVYSPQQKINVFENLYQDKIEVEQIIFCNYLNQYKKYIEWSQTHFNIQTIFDYDKDIKDIENFIKNLNFLSNGFRSWKDVFNQNFEDFNFCHKLLPDLVLKKSSVQPTKEISYFSRKVLLEYDAMREKEWPSTYLDALNSDNNLPSNLQSLKTNIAVTPKLHDFLTKNLKNYLHTSVEIEKLVENGILRSNVPIKLQTLLEKKQLIKNFSSCVDWYNTWVEENNFGKKIDKEYIDKKISTEETFTNRFSMLELQ